ncbi:MAG: quinate 5-dehydrogenase [Armatimonadetes bacterium]|nr:quinate 5-dehydrogenase [Armatimonadota bacterium]
MKRVVSIGPGSSTRNHRVEVELLGQHIVIEKIGTDGDLRRANALLRELDGNVDALGLANIDLYVSDGTRKHLLRDAARMVEGVSRTPLVDGGGFKDIWEAWLIREYLPHRKGISFRDKNVLLVCAAGRWGMAEALVSVGAEVIFGDLMFALGVPIPLRSLTVVKGAAGALLPILRHVPIRYLYPVGARQVEIVPRHGKYYAWADVIAGDFHYIRRHLPADLRRKIILTQTITPIDVEELRKRGAWLLITDFAPMGGRAFATNVLQAVVVALLEKRPEAISPQEYVGTLLRAGIEPGVEELTPA